MSRDLFQAISSGDVAAVHAILAEAPAQAGARNEGGVSAVLWAKYNGQDMALQALLAAGPALDAFEAAALGDLDRLTALLDEDPSRVTAFAADGFTPLHLAAYFGHRLTVGLLLDRGADARAVAKNPSRVEPLHSAVASGRCGPVGLLLERGADANPQQQGGFTPLHAAVKRGDFEMVGLLMDRGADPTIRDDDGRSALDHAGGEPRMLLLLNGV
ncbi:MAG: ankyrin repeat domain-containing protein [Planctomycetes bacterium]|nr:ankyrin repeat domain-containing protein [Planctomycetota bacterium]